MHRATRCSRARRSSRSTSRSLDVVGQAANGGAQPRLLVRVSGERVDDTGVGPGFSGSPILCPRADGTLANAGAISETIGEYGGYTVLATPIEQILGDAGRRAAAEARRGLSAARPLDPAQRQADLDADHGRRRSTAPSMRGLQARGRQARRRAARRARRPRRHARPMLPVRARARRRRRPLQRRPHASPASAPSPTSTATTSGPTGTSSTASARARLLLQDAYVAAIVNNPRAGRRATRPTSSSGAGARPRDAHRRRLQRGRRAARARCRRTTTVRVYASDDDRGLEREMQVNVADETDVGNPAGVSAAELRRRRSRSPSGATDVLGAAPQRVAGQMCMQVKLRERKRAAALLQPLRQRRRHQRRDASAPTRSRSRAGHRRVDRAALFDVYKGKPVHIDERDRAHHARRARSARPTCARSTLPERVRRGATSRAKLVAQVVRGAAQVVPLRAGRCRATLKSGKRKLRLPRRRPRLGGFGFFDDIIIELFGDGEDATSTPRARGRVDEARRGVPARRSAGTASASRAAGRFYRDTTYRIGGRALARRSASCRSAR